MDIDQAFPSLYISAPDLQGQDVPVIMADVRYEKVGEDQKPVLYFQGRKKGLVLNKTNATAIKGMYGAETAAWSGQQIVLFAIKTEYQGRTVDGVRCKAVMGVLQPPMNGGVPGTAMQPATNSTPPAPGNNPPPPAGDTLAADLDDEIPF